MDYCQGGLNLLNYDGKNWTDITGNLLPEFSAQILNENFNRVKSELDDKHTDDDTPPPIYYELPRRGTTITVRVGGMYASSDSPLFYLKWNGERFIVSETK